ncbi:integral membrane transport protein [Streptomyces sp. IMTB 2501]|uniref:integral membrane transport protein n=1 Tax=Streptomyces sp. IMTB 2501 TaxID=1776340 RepID=UPI00096DDEC7|nr:integral membrane transport protein [Streptomyces sp. IMTB 2501]
MTTVTEAVRVAPPGNPLSRSFHDSMVVAKRNLIRMSRIPDPVRSGRSGFISSRTRELHVSAGKGQAK